MKQALTCAAMAIAVTIAAAPAAVLAASSDGVTVKTGDLDLASAEGKAALDRRTRSAAAQVCAGETASESRLAAAQARRQCLDAVREQIQRQLVRRGT